MARYRHYDPQQTKMIAVSYGRQLLPGTFEHALSYLIDNEIDLDRFAARFKNDDTGALAYDPAVLLKVVLFAYSRGITSSRTMARAVRRTWGSLPWPAISSRISRRWHILWRPLARKWKRSFATC